MRHELFVCSCGSVEHQFIITSFDDEDYDDLYVEVHLSDVGFWNRLKYAFKYILGKRYKYGSGAFSEILLNKEITARLIEVLQNHHRRMK